MFVFTGERALLGRHRGTEKSTAPRVLSLERLLDIRSSASVPAHHSNSNAGITHVRVYMLCTPTDFDVGSVHCQSIQHLLRFQT